jgi:hypothetical protein
VMTGETFIPIMQADVWLNWQRGSWIAGIAAFTLSLLLNRAALAKFLKAHWGLVAGALTLGAICALYLAGWFDSILKLFTRTPNLPVWALLVIAILPLAIAIAVLGLWLACKLRPSQPNPLDYRADVIFDVEWIWEYNSAGIIAAYSIIPICPQDGCKHRLQKRQDWNKMNLYARQVPTSLVCPRCGFERAFDCEYERIINDVGEEIDRRIRTGKFIESLKGATSEHP